MVDSLEDIIIMELKNFNFKRNSLGYEYLIDAIKIVIEDSKSANNFHDSIYVPIGEKYGIKPENVLWCINKIIMLMYFNTNDEIITNYFEVESNEKITTKETFENARKELEKYGFIEVTVFGKNTRTENQYRFISKWKTIILPKKEKRKTHINDKYIK